MKLGARDVTAVRLGDRVVKRVMLGDRLVWDAADDPSPATTGGLALYGETSYGNSNVNWEMGWTFTVGANDITLDALMLYAAAAGTETVRLYRNSDQVVVASAVVTAEGGWGQESIAPVTLTAGTAYTISRDAGFTRQVATLGQRSVSGVNRGHPTDPSITGVTGRINTSGSGFPTTNAGALAGVNFRTIAPAVGYRFYRLNFTLANGGGRYRIEEVQYRANVAGPDVTGAGKATENSLQGVSYISDRLYDDNLTTFWWSATGAEAAWVAYDFGSGREKVIAEYAITSSTAAAEAPNAWTLEGSNDFETWDVLDTVTGETGWTSRETRVYSL